MTDHIHILGISGTFMGGVAVLAKESGYTVSGSDKDIYPPMSDQLLANDIAVTKDYEFKAMQYSFDQILVGNALSRGNVAVESMLDAGLPFVSGPDWLRRHVLQGRWVLAVSGTHGKTTTASMLAWILEYAGLKPGFLIGGLPANFDSSARLGQGQHFIIEADEYDTAFFDKSSKFLHYRPKTLIIGNLEFDHADIFQDLTAIETQFHHLIRCIPQTGHIICGKSEAIDRVLERGVWTPVTRISSLGSPESGDDWSWRSLTATSDSIEIFAPNNGAVKYTWKLIGQHNAANATAAMAAAYQVGVSLEIAAEALSQFEGVKRRLEFLGSPAGVSVYDDFAHHPTAIEKTLAAMKSKLSCGKLIAVIEPRSNTMRMGFHRSQLASSAAEADHVLWFKSPGLEWDLLGAIESHKGCQEVSVDVDELVDRVVRLSNPGDSIVVMTNGAFQNFNRKLLTKLTQQGN